MLVSLRHLLHSAMVYTTRVRENLGKGESQSNFSFKGIELVMCYLTILEDSSFVAGIPQRSGS